MNNNLRYTETHTCKVIDDDRYVTIYKLKRGNINNWYIEDNENEDHAFLIFYCPYCGVLLDE